LQSKVIKINTIAQYSDFEKYTLKPQLFVCELKKILELFKELFGECKEKLTVGKIFNSSSYKF